jgi:predicted metal-binding membrane protein
MDALAATRGVLVRDRVVVLLALAAIAALAWLYVIHMAGSMPAIPTAHVQPWGAVELLLMFLMWAVMMVAMMLPSAAPMILVFTSVKRRSAAGSALALVTGLFALAYLVVWIGFSLAATAANWALHQAGLMTAMMGSTLPLVGGILLLAAGVYQWTPLKHACLSRCRSPLAFLMTEWRPGRSGAFFMGLRHGLFCLGCCWALMTLLFVLGLMNLLWIAALAAIALLEKVLPGGLWVSRVLGIALIGWGAWMIAASLPH